MSYPFHAALPPSLRPFGEEPSTPCPTNRTTYTYIAINYNYQYSFESSCAFFLLVFLLYNICKYMYNEPKKTKDKLTILVYGLFLLSTICK